MNQIRAWNIGGISLIGEIELLGVKSVPVPLYPPHVVYYMDWPCIGCARG